MSLYLLATSYIAIALAGLIVGALFQVLGLTPTHHFVAVFQTRPTWNDTTFLDIAVLALIAVLGWRFLRTGGVEMQRSMENPDAVHAHGHHEHQHHKHRHQSKPPCSASTVVPCGA
jgi:hypothetical protein